MIPVELSLFRKVEMTADGDVQKVCIVDHARSPYVWDVLLKGNGEQPEIGWLGDPSPRGSNRSRPRRIRDVNIKI